MFPHLHTKTGQESGMSNPVLALAHKDKRALQIWMLKIRVQGLPRYGQKVLSFQLNHHLDMTLEIPAWTITNLLRLTELV